jgi:molecular chaperone GrpE
MDRMQRINRMDRMNRMDPTQPRTRLTRAEERAAGLDISPAKLAAEIERLTAERDAALRKAAAVAPPDTGELEGLRKERDDFLAALQRERAEFQNYRRRTAEEREASLGLAAESLISKALSLADDFDRAIESRPAELAADPWVDGVVAIDRKLRQLLESEGVRPIDVPPGAAFDPREQEAIASVPATGVPAGHVVEQLRRGYRLRDRVIRPAMVAVAEGGADRAHNATDGAVGERDAPSDIDTNTNRPLN